MSSKLTTAGIVYVGSLVYGGVWGYRRSREAPVQTTAKKIAFTVGGVMLGPAIALERAVGVSIKTVQWMRDKNGDS
jgi:hypothetical protein